MRYLGIDYGSKRIGLSLSDPLLITAQPLKVLENTAVAFDEISKICSNYGVEKIIVGLPKTLKGKNSSATQKVIAFTNKLRQKIPHIKIVFYDERLSTAEALKLTKGHISAKKQKEIIDKLAASYILQGFLDGLKMRKL